MILKPEPGLPVVVVVRAAQPAQWQGEIVALRDSSLAIRVNKPPETWNTSARCTVICGKPGSRVTAAAAFVARNGDVVAFRLTSGWKPLDLRKDARFTTDLTAEVRSVLGNSRQAGRIIDISMGGAAVSVEARPGGSQVEVAIWANGYGAHILCEVVGSSRAEEATVLRLRFRDLTPPQRAFVRQLVARLGEAQASAS